MPIYEFRCNGCQHIFELLEMTKGDQVEARCPKCGSGAFERVMSRTNYAMGGSSSPADSGPGVNARSCDGGNCATLNLPGPSR